MKDYLCKKLFNRLSGTLVIRARCGNNITGVRPFAAEGRSPWGGRPALAGREGSRRGAPRRARSRAQGAAPLKQGL